MKVKDMPEAEIKVGLRIKSLVSDKRGTVISIDPTHDNLAWIKWDDEDIATTGFYGNDCECEVVDD